MQTLPTRAPLWLAHPLLLFIRAPPPPTTLFPLGVNAPSFYIQVHAFSASFLPKSQPPCLLRNLPWPLFSSCASSQPLIPPSLRVLWVSDPQKGSVYVVQSFSP